MRSIALLVQTRTRTFVRKMPPAVKKYIAKKTAAGEIPFERFVMENKFFKVEGNMKIYKAVTNGQRNRRHPTRFHLWNGPCLRHLSFGRRSTGGRNHTGKIVVRHRGGGHKRRIRILDWNRSLPGPQVVVRLEYDPNRSADLCLVRNLATNELSYIIRPQNVNPGDVVESFVRGLPSGVPIVELIKPGNCLRLGDIPVGTQIHCIGLRSNGPAQLCRGAGSSGTVMFVGRKVVHVRLQSKEVRILPADAVATIGAVGNEEHWNAVWGKAGAARWRGIRPTVRGIAMSAYDHPHGGGYKSKGNKHPRSPWGLKKGVRTGRKNKPFVLVPRWGGSA